MLVPLPDKPTNLTITAITSRSATISWQDPKHLGLNSLSNFRIELKKGSNHVMGVTTPKVNEYRINNLTPYTTYEVSVASGNKYGFDAGTISSFSTSEAGKCKNVSI